nr:LysR family transcriptional regulator [Streptomyces alkaliphilus]
MLRAFVAVAEELHFTRAAARLFTAQQALSRDIRRMEREWGVTLFARSTRHVALTAEGERLLPVVRRVLTALDELAGAVGGVVARPLVVDVAAPAATGRGVLDEARAAAPDLEFVARFHSGLTGAAAEMVAGRVDVSFGRFAGLAAGVRAVLEHRLIRWERVAVLLPETHPLAGTAELPLSALAGERLYAGVGNPETAEWTDYARALVAGRGIELVEPFPKIEGDTEFVRVVRRQGWSVLASEVFTAVPGMVLRPLTDPVPYSPVSMVWRRGLRHPGLTALLGVAPPVAPTPPAGGWLPEPDREVLTRRVPAGPGTRRAGGDG